MGQVLDNISQFADEIRADGVEGDKLMRLTDGSAKRLRDSGVIRMFPAEGVRRPRGASA